MTPFKTIWPDWSGLSFERPYLIKGPNLMILQNKIRELLFYENCIFWPKTVDFAVSVWLMNLKLENCWLVLSPEWLRGVSTCSEVDSLKFDSWTGQRC